MFILQTYPQCVYVYEILSTTIHTLFLFSGCLIYYKLHRG
nr:MAG TPA: hypothetical protein [Inoviridae sp.]